MFFFPVIWKDVWLKPNRSRFHVKRQMFVALFALIVLVGFIIALDNLSTTIGIRLFHSLYVSMVLVSCPLAAFMAGLSIVQERRSASLLLLLLTSVTPRRYLLEKWGSALFTQTFMILSILPLLLLATTLGGISLIQILVGLWVMLSLSLLSGALGLLAACYGMDEKRFFIATIFFIALFFILPASLVVWFGIAPSSPVACSYSAFWTAQAVSLGSMLKANCINALINVGCALIGITLALVWFPMTVFTHDTFSVSSEGSARSPRSRRWVIPPCKHNPLLWKDFFFVYNRTPVRTCIALFISVTFAILLSGHFTGFQEAFAFSCFAGAVVITVFFGLSSLIRGARAFQVEINAGTMDLLLLSDLHDQELVWGKLMAIWKAVLPLALLAATLWLMALSLGWQGGFFFLSEPLLSSITSIFTVTCLALWLSLRRTLVQTLGICLFAFVFWVSCIRHVFILYILLLLDILLGSTLTSLLSHSATPVPVRLFSTLLPSVCVDIGAGLMFIRLLFFDIRHLAVRRM